MSNLIVSKSFDRLAEEFKQHDQQAGKSFVAMLNVQEAAKVEYQETTGKVHGFIAIWAEVTGAQVSTVKKYNWLAGKTVELRKKGMAIHFSGLSQDILSEYASAPEEIQEVIQELMVEGEKVTPRDIRQMREPAVIDDEPEEEVWRGSVVEPAPRPYKPKVYDMPVDERLQSCALGVVHAACQFHLANLQTGGRLTHDQVVRAIRAELVTTSTPHTNKAKVYREAHEQTEQFLAVFAEAFAEISPTISLNKVSSI